jgi:hypothetical protein
MPINDPIKRERVAPGSLAFDSRRRSTIVAGQSSPGGVTTTQQYITNIYGPTFRVNNNVQLAERRLREVMAAMSNAESRAKHYVGDWHHAFEWDSAGATLQWNATNVGIGPVTKLKFRREVVRAVGAFATNSDSWLYRPPNEAIGTYHIDVACFVRVSPVDKIQQARLAVLVNGQLWRHVGITNSRDTDRQHLEEIQLQGSCIVPLSSGDYLEAGIYLVGDDAAVTGSSSGPTNYYAYISGHRVKCEATYVNTPTTGTNFDNSI